MHQKQMEKIEKPLRIALVMGKYVTGGIKSVMMNYYNHIDREQVQFDFLVDDDSPIKDYSEIEKLGGRVYEIPSLKHPIRNIRACIKILTDGKYLCVHGYINTLNVFPMFAGKIAGVPVRIAENLSTAHPGERKTVLKNILKPFSRVFPTHLAANSKYAAEWLYGANGSSKCKIIYNALNLEQFKYDPVLRQEKRTKMGIEGCFVLGHIGRYHYQKNHEFLIDIFSAVYKRDSSARLILIGYGVLKDHIFEKIASLGLTDVVIDGGATENIMPYYNAMDCFVLPSFYEGLPVVGIEAQATGVPCVMSSEVTSETGITDCAQFIGLDKSAEYWADQILKWKQYNRVDVRQQITEHGYNILNEAKKLEQYYFKCLSETGNK